MRHMTKKFWLLIFWIGGILSGSGVYFMSAANAGLKRGITTRQRMIDNLLKQIEKLS